MSLSDYERLHSTYLYSPVHQFAAKWFSLARFSITKFGWMDYGNCYWYHVHANEARPLYRGTWGRKPETLPLLMFDEGMPRLRRGFHYFREHLEGSLTLGIWPDLDNRFTVIDLDGDQVSRWQDLRDRLIDLHLHFCIEFSGGKGLHFWVFWNQDLSNTELIELHEFLCDGIPSDHNCWPFKRSLIKLPLGLHRKTNQLARYLDYEGQPIPLEDQFDYFLTTKTNSIPREFENRTEVLSKESSLPHVICINAEEKEVPNPGPTAMPDLPPKIAEEEKNASAYEECLRLGRKLSCGRHKTLFYLAIHLKENRKLDRNQSLSILEEWSSRVPSKHPLRERLRDARSTVERVYEKGIHGAILVRSDLTEEEVRVIQRVCKTLISVCVAVGSRTRREDLAKRLKTTLKVALTMVSLAKTQNGTVEISYRTLAKLSGVSMNTLQRCLRVLVEDGLPIPEHADIDPVLWYTDLRPKRSGGLFRCPRRGTYANRSNSVYHVKDTIRQALGWA